MVTPDERAPVVRGRFFWAYRPLRQQPGPFEISCDTRAAMHDESTVYGKMTIRRILSGGR
jgi:hypothetical protein